MLINGNSSRRTSPQSTERHKSSTFNSTVNHDSVSLGFVDRKIDLAIEGLQSNVQKWLKTRTSKRNAVTISEYIISLRREINPSQNYRKMQIQALIELSEYSEQKPFKQMKSEDILSFLDKFRKCENKDPLHKWIGTYNLKREILRQFFTWLSDPDTNRNHRLRPRIMEGIPQLKRKEVSIYKPSDLWTQEDDLLFLKYCPSNRDRCYHMLSRDSSCRPSELLKLRMGDVVFKTSGEYQYAEITVNGKTGRRTIPLFSCIPYLKDWLDEHPQRSNSNAALFPSMSDKNFGRQMMSSEGIHLIYRKYKLVYFPKLLEDPAISSEDKIKIKDLLKKPWNPYIRRHSALTEKAQILKEPILKMHAGWSARSQMNLKYEHWFGNESSHSLLEAYGIVTKSQELSEALRPKQCPNCNEPNKPDSKFCSKCRMVLTYDAYSETLEKQQERESEVHALRDKYEQDMKAMREEMNQKVGEIISMLQQNPLLSQIKPEILTQKKINTEEIKV